jgi:hypothetical protein
MVLIGDGFKLSVSAEVVDTSGFKNPIAAFETAESTSAVTELSSDSSEN